jgi:tRNA pseudouridine55 synthase
VTESFFIFLDKPEGATSQQCLSRFKRKFGFDKVGHHGTLDPFATGLLLVGVNEAAKFFRFVADESKTYEAVIEFGVATDTLDKTGTVTSRRDIPSWTRDEIETALRSLTGEIKQKPPMYSAVKKNGERLYSLARRGVEVEREERDVRVHELLALSWDHPRLTVRAAVSRGTYVRVLAEQIAARLDNVAHLTGLRRTEVCGVPVARAFDFENAEMIPVGEKIPIPELLGAWPRLDLDAAQRTDLFFGRTVQLKSTPTPHFPTEFFRTFHDGEFLGMAVVRGDLVTVERLMNPSRR